MANLGKKVKFTKKLQVNNLWSTSIKDYKNNTLVCGCAGDEKNLHLGSCNIFFNRFSGDILFSSLVFFFCFFFCFFVFLFFFLFCFLKLEIYILIHIQLCGQVSDKIFFTEPISRNKTTFFLAQSSREKGSHDNQVDEGRFLTFSISIILKYY